MRPTFWVRSLRGILDEVPSRPWKVSVLLESETPALARFHAHVSVLMPGAATNEPCGHVDEELAIVMEGELGVLGPAPEGAGLVQTLVGERDCAFHASWDVHDYQNPSDRVVRYLVLRWNGWTPPRPPASAGGSTLFGRSDEHGAPALDLPTGHLDRLRVSNLVATDRWILEPSSGSDRMILLSEGAISLAGLPVQGPSLIAVPAGSPLRGQASASQPVSGKLVEFEPRPTL